MANRRKPLVVVTRKLPDTVETRMCELFDTRLNVNDRPMSHADLVEAVKTADILVPTVTDRIDSALLGQSGEQLRLIANFGNGVDHIDLATALQRGITVTNTPGVLTEDTADMTMALILAVPRRARPFGLQIHYHNRRRVVPKIESELEATYWESLDQMLARMDIISVNCPHTPATYHLLSARRLKLLRPDAYVVNTARGEVIDENALTRM